MIPRLLHLPVGDGVVHLAGYGFPALCGALAALLPLLRRAREAGLPRRRFLAAVLLALLGGFAGAKLFAVLQTGSWSGRVLYGGLLGGLAGLLAAARGLRLPPLACADVLAPPALLVAAFGRVGCFFAGCCYGMPWAEGVAYPRGGHVWAAHLRAGLVSPDATSSLPTLPMPLLEAAALAFIALAAARAPVGSGRVAAWAGLLYSSWRFAAEFGRGDHAPYAGLGLTFSQAVSLLVFAASAVALRGARAPRPASPAAERFGWVSLAQVSLLLAMVVAGSGSVGCSSRRTRETQENAREYHSRGRDKAKEYYQRAREEFKEDCVDDCAQFCCEMMCDVVCQGDGEEDEDVPEAPVEPPVEKDGRPRAPPPPRFTLPQIRPGEIAAFALDLEGSLNQRTDFRVRIAGDVEGLPHLPDAVPYRLGLATLELRLGELRLKAKPGDVELRLDAQGDLTLAATTLDAEALRALKALDPITQGLLRLPGDIEPARGWGEALTRELWARDAQGHGRGKVSWNGKELGFEVRAWISEPAVGLRRVRWIVR